MKRTIATISFLLLSTAFTGGAGAATPLQIAPQQELVALADATSVRHSPDGSVLETVAATRPITREQTVLPVLSAVIDNSVDAKGQLWLQVRLPGRVLGQKAPPQAGWISSSGTTISSTAWHLVVDLGARRVLVYDAGVRVRSYAAVVGKSSTPTPTGEYFVEENVKMAAGAPGAPFALATSDRSSVLHEFEGGPGQIAIHGVENLGGTLGTAESHGCIRLATSAITWIASRIGPGVPITIT
ncbi:MAG TPA: L,D-transpeptidase [Solirubrobacteraceae bacterium]|nr:L,D-transpeptidase [Solirubrobacteraceae bacterium]